jgi:hypothetical protein
LQPVAVSLKMVERFAQFALLSEAMYNNNSRAVWDGFREIFSQAPLRPCRGLIFFGGFP